MVKKILNIICLTKYEPIFKKAKQKPFMSDTDMVIDTVLKWGYFSELLSCYFAEMYSSGLDLYHFTDQSNMSCSEPLINL